MSTNHKLRGERFEISIADDLYPNCLKSVRNPPERIFIIGNIAAIHEGLAVIGARKATKYGIDAATKFAGLAAECGIPIISGGARGCDSASHRAALDKNAETVVVLGGGIDRLYPKENQSLFQEVIDKKGAVISEHPWDEDPRRYFFRARNRIIAGMSRATLIVEAGLPSGTFSTADEALECGRAVLAVPGSINSRNSLGSNMLIYQGATPVIDEDTFSDQLKAIFEITSIKNRKLVYETTKLDEGSKLLVESLRAEAMTLEELLQIANRCSNNENPMSWLLVTISKLQEKGLITCCGNGRYSSSL